MLSGAHRPLVSRFLPQLEFLGNDFVSFVCFAPFFWLFLVNFSSEKALTQRDGYKT